MSEPENIVLMLLREIRADMTTKAELAAVTSELKNGIAETRAEVGSLRADVASDLLALDKHLTDRITHLNRAVVEYHSSAFGPGVLISELEERLSRVEQHLKLPPHEAH
jgi:hypothetical protein